MQCNYVPTADNPADIISRGCSVSAFKEMNFWFNGPDWLYEVSMQMVRHPPSLVDDERAAVFNEEKKIIVGCSSIVIVSDSITHLCVKYSNFGKSSRVLAWVRRFIANCQGKVSKNRDLSLSESKGAELVFIAHYQRLYFEKELAELRSDQCVCRQSPLFKLNAFLDDEGILRVHGRIQRAAVPFSMRNPIIVPAKSELDDLLILSAHHLCLHGGPQVTLNVLRRRYWVVKGLQRVKSIIRKCIRCFRARPTNKSQVMGLLPAPRVQFSKAFLHTGVDFAGPVRLRISVGRGTRTTKGYFAVFVCLAVKAIHLEVVSSLTTDAFIAAIIRFRSRRGTIAQLYSDNATNFVGAFRKLGKVDNALGRLDIEWSFIPPQAPHFGGLWEAGVKSVKTHLKRACADRTFTFEEMQTVLCQVEACLNSRPLCPLTDDLDSLDALTPNHFITGDQFTAVKEGEFSLLRPTLLTRWQQLTKIYQDVCTRYKSEYLSRLLTRPKWNKATENIKLGQLVLMRKDGVPTTDWPLGRIVGVRPGADGKVRVVTVRTSKGEKVRAISKVCPLPVDAGPAASDVPPVSPST